MRITREDAVKVIIYIGTRKIVALLGSCEHEEPRVLRCVIRTRPEGFQEGYVSNLERAAAVLQEMLDELFEGASVSDYSAYVVLGNSKLKTYSFSSSQYFQGEQRTIASGDVRSIIQQTKSVATLPLTEFILQAIPDSFLVNDMYGIRNPLGLEAQRLGVDLKLFTMNFQDFKNLSKAFDAAEIDVIAYFPKTLTVAEAVLTEIEKEEGAVIVDIANDVTQLIAWKNGTLAATKAIPFGGRQLTTLISDGWKIDITDSDRVKERFASMSPTADFGEELIPLVERNGKDNHQMRRQDFHRDFLIHAEKWVNPIIGEAKMFIDDQKMVYPNFIFTGGAAAIDGFLEFVLEKYEIEGRIGLPRLVQASQELLLDPSLPAGLGMLRWLAMNDRQQRRLIEPAGIVEKTWSSARDWFLTYF